MRGSCCRQATSQAGSVPNSCATQRDQQQQTATDRPHPTCGHPRRHRWLWKSGANSIHANYSQAIIAADLQAEVWKPSQASSLKEPYATIHTPQRSPSHRREGLSHYNTQPGFLAPVSYHTIHTVALHTPLSSTLEGVQRHTKLLASSQRPLSARQQRSR